MRYSFHGKVRATGQLVDGFVEAANSTQAIDRLADQGIIGVYSVRPEPKIPKNAVRLSHEAGFEEEEDDTAPRPEGTRRERPRLERPVRRPPVEQPAPAPMLPAPAPVEAAAPTPVAGPSEVVMAQLVDKLSTLLVQVEKLLSRPPQVVYQSGPARNGGGGGGTGKKSRMPSDAQNNTLRDIFQTNLDLRQSLEKLANTVNPPTVRTNGEAASPVREPAMPSTNGNGRERAVQAQPAA